MNNNNPAKLSTLSETLFIPLLVRANETASEAAVIKDPKAVEIINKVSINGIITDGGSVSTLGILARTTVIDSEIQKLLSQVPNPLSSISAQDLTPISADWITAACGGMTLILPR